jgi:alpha-galactosidase/6-phospho-beta-glucosidase family protein
MHDRSWAVARVKFDKEQAFMSDLSTLNYESYCPFQKILIRPRHKRKPTITLKPLYSGYVFVQHTSDIINSVSSSKQFVGLINYRGVISTIDDEIISNIKAFEKELSATTSTSATVPNFQKNEILQIIINSQKLNAIYVSGDDKTAQIIFAKNNVRAKVNACSLSRLNASR